MSTAASRRPFGPFERMLALRYLRAKREHGGLALISIVSVIGITLAVFALITIMSIMNGFRLELLSKVVGFEPHAYVITAGMPQERVEQVMESAAARADVVAVEPMIIEQVLASANGVQTGVEVRGVRPADLRGNRLIVDGMEMMREARERDRLAGVGWSRYSDPGELGTFGEGELGAETIVVGSGFARQLGLLVGDRVALTTPKGAFLPTGRALRTKTYTVGGIFNVGNERYDQLSLFMPIEEAALFFGYDAGYPLVGVRVGDPDRIEAFVEAMSADDIRDVRDWKTMNASYVTALIVERNVMRLIMMIVVAVTSLNIITGVLMLVKNKARDIAILRTIGATRAGVVRIFLMTGSLLGMVGVATGLVLGVLFVLNIHAIQLAIEAVTGFELFPKDVYMLEGGIPAQLQWSEVILVAAFAFAMSVVTTLIPSLWASRLDPVEALRFQ
jgi:lipoprotein-releasing system permease protein